jgi:hypothetical protein
LEAPFWLLVLSVLFVLFFLDAFEPKGKLNKGEMRPR